MVRAVVVRAMVVRAAAVRTVVVKAGAEPIVAGLVSLSILVRRCHPRTVHFFFAFSLANFHRLL
jgi:hypothetical protein